MSPGAKRRESFGVTGTSSFLSAPRRRRGLQRQESLGHAELFLLDHAPREGEEAVMTGAEARHACRVKRHRPKDRVSATDGRGFEYDLELASVRPDRVSGRVVATRERPREPECRLVLAQAIIKGDHLSEVVSSATQLGAAEVIPLQTKRVVAGLSRAKLVRLRAVAQEAMKSAARTVLPEVGEPVSLSELLERAAGFDRALVADEEEKGRSLEEALEPDARSVLLVIGPEGGFEREEICRMEGAGVRRFTLGPRRMRAETAAAAAVALVLHRVGDMGGTGRQ